MVVLPVPWQAAEHEHGGRRGAPGQAGDGAAHHLRQLFADDFDDLLRGRKAFQHVCAYAALRDLADKILRYEKVDIRFQQRHAHLAHRGFDVCLAQLPRPDSFFSAPCSFSVRPSNAILRFLLPQQSGCYFQRLCAVSSKQRLPGAAQPCAHAFPSCGKTQLCLDCQQLLLAAPDGVVRCLAADALFLRDFGKGKIILLVQAQQPRAAARLKADRRTRGEGLVRIRFSMMHPPASRPTAGCKSNLLDSNAQYSKKKRYCQCSTAK